MSEGDTTISDDSETDENGQCRDKQAPPQSAVMAGVWNESQPYSPQLTTAGSSNCSETDSIPAQHRLSRESATDTPGATTDLTKCGALNTPPPFEVSIPSLGHQGGRLRFNEQGNDGETFQRSCSSASEDMEDMDDDSFIDTDPQWATCIKITSLTNPDPLGKATSRLSSISSSSSTASERSIPRPLTTPMKFPANPLPLERGNAMEDNITDTVGAIAIDCFGNIAAASSSGGIGMKHKGRTGPAALVGIGTAVMPVEPDDKHKTCVAAVTSGTGEHMATTMAASTCASRLYFNHRKGKDGKSVHANEEEAIQSFVQKDFMGRLPESFPVQDSNAANAYDLRPSLCQEQPFSWSHWSYGCEEVQRRCLASFCTQHRLFCKISEDLR